LEVEVNNNVQVSRRRRIALRLGAAALGIAALGAAVWVVAPSTDAPSLPAVGALDSVVGSPKNHNQVLL
jgi:hypothetical protein